MKTRFAIFIVLTAVVFNLVGCGKNTDQKDYEAVVASLSVEKARVFFGKHPDSKYRDILIDDMVSWCKNEPGTDCYKLILRAIPANSSRYPEVLRLSGQ